MAQASARRSFHGPLLVAGRPHGPAVGLASSGSTPSSVGRAILRAARAEAPSERARELVLLALRRLTTDAT